MSDTADESPQTYLTLDETDLKETCLNHDHESTSDPLEQSGAGARQRTSKISVADLDAALERMSSSNEGMQGHIRRVRQWSDDVLVEFGKGISDLRDWHTRESEKDNNLKSSSSGRSSSSRASPKLCPLPTANDVALQDEVRRERTKCYALRTKLEVSEHMNKSLQPQLNSIRAQLDTVEHQRAVELAQKDDDISGKQKEIEQLKRENVKLRAELEQRTQRT